MEYINQREYSHIPYHTHVKMEGVSEEDKLRNVARSGCGLCCACMVVNALTNNTLRIEDCVAISEDCEANYGRGTDMTVLGPVIAEKYNMTYAETNDVEEVVAHLQKGGQAIIRAGIPEGKEIGLFVTNWGHFMVLVSTDGKDFCVLDPSYTKEKYEIPERAEHVDISHAPYLYCDIHKVDAEGQPGYTKYYLFARKR